MATVKALHIAIGARVEGFQRGMSKAQRSLRDFEKSTRRARGMVVGATGAMARGFAAVGAAATVAIADSIRVFADFETSMLRVKAITGSTGAEFESLTDLARELGATTAFTAREAAQAMGFLAQAGFDVKEINQALPKVLSLAAAGQLELASAADITASVLRGFGLSANESGRVADVLAASASSANTSVEEMGEAFKFAGPVASAMGVSIEETAAALGVLSNAGLKGSLAGTGLRMVLVKMGEDIANAGGLLPALERLDTDGVQAVVDTMKDLDARAGTAAVALTKQLGTVKELRAAFRDADGAADSMAETMLSGIEGSAVKTGSALEGLRIQIGETFGDVATGFFDELTATFQAMNKEIAGSEDAFKNLETAGMMIAKGLVFAFEMVASAIALVGDTIVDMTSGLSESIIKIDNLARGLRGGFGAEGILSKEDRKSLQAVLDFGKGRGALDRVSNFFAQIDAMLDPTSRATRQGPVRGAGMDAFEAALGFGRLRSTAADRPGIVGASEQVAEKAKEQTEELDRFLEGMAALPEDVMMMMERRGLGQFAEQLLASDITQGDLAKLTKLLDQSETLRGDATLFEEVRDAILESFIDLPEPEKKEPEDPVRGFAETIDTVLGQVRVDPLAGKKDSQNLDIIAKASQRTARALESSGGAFS